MRLRLRCLPPVGGRISPRALFGALRDSVVAASGGPTGVQGLRSQLAARTGLSQWVLTNSGRAALSIVLMALRAMRPGRDEVVIPAYTSYSVPAAVVRAGLRVRLCDIETDTLGLSPKELERVLTARTLCIVPNHLYGLACQIKAICEIARERTVPVVEDAAQAMGITNAGLPVGTFGDAAIFSLSRGKILPAAGGGLIGTNEKTLAQQCHRMIEATRSSSKEGRALGLRGVIETTLMALFIHPSLYWLPASLPFLKLGASRYDPGFQIGPMTRFQESLAARLLPAFVELQSIRRRNANLLRRALTGNNGTAGFWIVWPRQGEVGGFLRLPLLLRDSTARNRVLAELERQGLGATGGYPLPLSEIAKLRAHLAGPDDEFPVAKRVSTQLVTLPTHACVTDRDVERMKKVFQQCAP